MFAPRLQLHSAGCLAATTLATLWLLAWASGLRFVYNATESEPRGWYLARPATGPLTRGQLILFPVPASVAGLVAERRWLPPGVPLLKRVGALAGDTVCVDAVLRVRGAVVGPVLAADAFGRPLPVARPGCFTIAPGYLFPVGAAAAGSFDGRYFGAIPIRAVQATAVPLWTFARRPATGLLVRETVSVPMAGPRQGRYTSPGAHGCERWFNGAFRRL